MCKTMADQHFDLKPDGIEHECRQIKRMYLVDPESAHEAEDDLIHWLALSLTKIVQQLAEKHNKHEVANSVQKCIAWTWCQNLSITVVTENGIHDKAVSRSFATICWPNSPPHLSKSSSFHLSTHSTIGIFSTSACFLKRKCIA